jgi:predicted ATPase
MKLETIEIHNFKVFQDVKFENIGLMGVFLGENGAGKTTFFDIFSFMKTCLTENVRSALQARGGYNEVHSRDTDGDIKLIFKYRLSPDKPLRTYIVQIGLNSQNEPIVSYEALYADELNRKRYVFARKGMLVTYFKWQIDEFVNLTGDYPPEFKMSDDYLLALNVIGQMAEYQEAVEFRKYVDDWFVSEFQIDKMRSTQDIAYNESLNRKGDNIANVAHYLFDKHSDRFEKIINKMQDRIPGVAKVEAKPTEEGKILLRFQDGPFRDPFTSKYVSDGTIKMFAYLVMLADPNPHKLLCIEEPENQLYPRLLEIFAEEFREYATQDGQVFISTHSPDLVNALEPQELFYIKKQENGYSQIKSVAEDEQIVNLFNEGDKLGYLWKEGILEATI